MMDDTPAARNVNRRPELVWIISVLYVFGGLSTPCVTYLAVTGHLPLTPARRHFYDGFGTLNYMEIAVTSVLGIAFGVQLFRLKASAPYLITVLFLAGVAKEVWYPTTAVTILARIVGQIMVLCIVGYCWHLRRSGRLT
jgi:uncharacterized membrane protein YccC